MGEELSAGAGDEPGLAVAVGKGPVVGIDGASTGGGLKGGSDFKWRAFFTTKEEARRVQKKIEDFQEDKRKVIREGRQIIIQH